MTILLAAFLVAGLSLVQVFSVPVMASGRGHAGALWFMVTVLWLSIFAVGGVVAGFAGGVFLGLTRTSTLIDETFAALAVAYALLAWLPTVAVLCVQRREAARRFGTRVGRRGAPRRGRSFSHSARE